MRNYEIFTSYQMGVAISKIARDYGISRQRVYQIVEAVGREKGVELRKKIFTPPPIKQRRFVFPSMLIQSCRDKRLTRKELASQFGCSVTTVRKAVGPSVPDYALIFQAYKAGRTIKELSELFERSVMAISVAIHRGRKHAQNSGGYCVSSDTGSDDSG